MMTKEVFKKPFCFDKVVLQSVGFYGRLLRNKGETTMRKLITLFISTFILIGCNNDNEENVDYHFEGINLGLYSGVNLLTIFVEDNYGGNQLEREIQAGVDYDHYWV